MFSQPLSPKVEVSITEPGSGTSPTAVPGGPRDVGGNEERLALITGTIHGSSHVGVEGADHIWARGGPVVWSTSNS